MAPAFSIRGYVEKMRGTAACELGPFGSRAEDLPPMEVRKFRWWEDELAAAKATDAEAEEEEEEAAVVPRTSPGKGRAQKKRSLSDLIAAAPPVDAPDGGGVAEAAEMEEDEPLCAIMRRTVEKKRKRRLLEESAAAAAAAAEEETATETGAAGREAEGNFARKKALDKPKLASKEPESEHLSTQKGKLPDLDAMKQGKIKNLQEKAQKLKYNERRKAIKVGKQRDLKKMLPLHSILKKYTKRTVKLVTEKHVKSKGSGVIELHQKSVKCVKISEANNTLGTKIKQSSKADFCKLVSDAITSSSSFTDMSLEGDKNIVAESSSCHMPEKALFDLNQALPESNSEVSHLENAQGGTFNHDQQVFCPGVQDSCALPDCTIKDSTQQQQNWCSMDLNYGVSQLSTVGEAPLSQRQEHNMSHSDKPIFHSQSNVQQESRPASGHTMRLMGKDLTVFKTGVDYLAETAQEDTGPSTDEHVTTKVVLQLPRQGQPFLSLQAQSIPIVSENSASTSHISANSPSTNQKHFGYITHNLSHPLPTANVFSGDRSPYGNRLRDFSTSQSDRNVILGRPPLPNHSSVAFRQNYPSSWGHYSDQSTRIESPTASVLPAMTRCVTSSSDYHVNLPQPYGVYSASSSVHSHDSASFTWRHPDLQGVSGGRAPAALPSRNVVTGMSRAVPDNADTSPSSRFVLRSGPVKLSAGAKHILMPSENTEDDNSAPVYSCVSFGSRNENASAPQNEGAGFQRF
ncbi:hypothetical protein ACP70R_030959 [Stipagrostis hirtigluma subsp. patula]